MKKIALLLVLLIIETSCSSTKNTMDVWLGATKQNFIKSWGLPIRTLDNNQKGEIFIYADQIYANPDTQNNSSMAGKNYWNYTYVYVNTEGKITSWRKEKQVFPPQQINANQLIDANSITEK